MRKIAALCVAGLVTAGCLSPASATEKDTPGVVESGDEIFVADSHAFGPVTPFLPVKMGSHCSLGPVLTPTTAVTAGHCGEEGSTVTAEGRTIGTITQLVDGMDLAVITLKEGVDPQLSTLGDVPDKGADIWKRGERTGVTRGTVQSGLTKVEAQGAGVFGRLGLPADPLGIEERTAAKHPSTVYLTDMCAAQGDSGAAVYSGDTVVGVVSAVTGDCNDPDYRAAVVPVL